MKFILSVILLLGVSSLSHAGNVKFILSKDVCVAESMIGGGAPNNGSLRMHENMQEGQSISSGNVFRMCARFQVRCGDPISDWYCSSHTGDGTFERNVP